MSGGDGRRLRVGAALLLAGVVQFFVCEAVCASQWHSAVGARGYDYARNWISDLGAPGRPAVLDGARFVSPLHAVMNVSFGATAALGLAAGLLLTGVLRRSRLRLLLRALVVVFAAGVALVALVPETVDITVHNTAASLTIAADVIAVVVGLRGPRLGVPRWVARCGLALGLLGCAVGGLFAVDVLDTAVAERVADYAPLVACALGAVVALLPRRRAATPVQDELALAA